MELPVEKKPIMDELSNFHNFLEEACNQNDRQFEIFITKDMIAWLQSNNYPSIDCSETDTRQDGNLLLYKCIVTIPDKVFEQIKAQTNAGQTNNLENR